MTKEIFCSIIIPVLNEENSLPEQLAHLQPLRDAGHEVIVVDGGSDDASVKLAMPYVDKLLHSPKGRAMQMNHGAAYAQHEWLLFLHVDTHLPTTAMDSLQAVFVSTETHWGRFDVQLSGEGFLFRVIASLMNIRSRASGIATGDQAMFVKKSSFNFVSGFPNIALMEDITLSRSLKSLAAPICLTDKVMTSNRRWMQHGVLRTILLMWSLRLRYFFGTNAMVLAERYNRASK